jgi:hypothetical protein
MFLNHTNNFLENLKNREIELILTMMVSLTSDQELKDTI